jgi:predicted nucleotidyltransferase
MKINSLHTAPLDEVSMSPSSLEDFANTDIAKSAVFGFEAEMLIPDLEQLTGEEGLRVPDYSKDKPFPTSLMWGDRVLHFFTSGDWPNNRRAVETALEKYETAYVNWLDDDFSLRLHADLQPALFKAVGLELKTKNLDEINQSIDNEDASYMIAVEKLRERFLNKNRLAEFAAENRIKTMKQFWERYGGDIVAWPYTKLDSEEPSGKTIDDLEYDFVIATGFTTSTSKIYHAVSRRSDLWIFEPDSSIEPDDPDYGGIELVSPPMPLLQGLAAMDTFFEWAHSYGVATNETTGFHINLSLPPELMSELDPIKLILFIGDKYILDQFDRANSQFAKNLIDQLTDRVSARSRRGLLGGLAGMFNQMKRRMDVVAIDVLADLLPQHDRHVSINIKDKYIEFRSAGGDYIGRYDEIRLTVLRCVRALAIACDPAAEQREYAKKLYKVFGEYTSTHRDVIEQFVKYAAGKISKPQLKDMIKYIQQNRDAVKESETANMSLSLAELKELLDLVHEQQEIIDDESFNVKPDTVAYKRIDNDYKALTAIEYVIKNNIKAIKNPDLQQGAIFLYDWQGYDDEIGAIQLQITDSVAEIKWLGSYNSSGKQLMAKGLEQAKAMGATKVKLTSKWNSGDYYKKQGFTSTGSEETSPLTDVGGEYTKDIKEYSVKSYIKQPEQTEEAASTVDQLLQRYSDMPGDPNTWISNKVKKLDNIISVLRKNAYAPELKIFGDAARQDDTVPDDVAIFIDLNKIRLDKTIMRSALNEILELSAKYRGMLLPYILVGNQLWTKNDDSTTWVKASKSDILSQGRQGLPITLFDRSFTKIGYAGVSESSPIKSSVLDWIEEVKKPVQIMIDNQPISEHLVKQYSAIELAAILGGHSID